MVVTTKSKNGAGIEVPVNREEHLEWWLHQVPKVEVSRPSPEIATRFIQCSYYDDQTKPVPPHLRDNFVLKIFEKRLTVLGMVAKPWMVVFIASICTSPAHAVLWAYFLKVHSILVKSNLMSLEDIKLVFPLGLPNEAGMRAMWDLQKLAEYPAGASDNLLDYIKMDPNET